MKYRKIILATVALLLVPAWPALRAAEAAPAAPAPADQKFPLQQIVLLESSDDIGKPPPVAPDFVVATGALQKLNTPELTKRLIEGKGRPIDTPLLGGIVQVVTIFLKQNDFPVADIVVPDQNIREGVLRLVVYLGKLRQIRTEGNHWFNQSVVQGRLGMVHGDTIRYLELERAMAWANNTNPFRQVKLRLDPLPNQKGEYDLVVGVEERLPLRLNAAYDNTGNEILGENRYSAGVTYGNVFGREHQFTYQFITTDDTKLFQAHSAFYQAPLQWRRHVFQASATLVNVSTTFLGGYFEQRGRSISADSKYIVPFKRGRWQGEVSAAAAFRQSDNNLEFLGLPALGTVTDTLTFAVAGAAIREDQRGRWMTSLTLTGSPGTFNSRSEYNVYQDNRIGANPVFGHAHLLVQRGTFLTPSLVSNLRAIGQVATTNLLPSEQFSLGGMSTVRGYRERILSGDHGYIFSHELQQRLPSVPLGSRIPKLDLAGVFFWDYGRAIIKKPLRGELKSQYLASVGVGLRASLSRYFSASVDYGRQLEEVEQPGEPHHRFHLKATLTY